MSELKGPIGIGEYVEKLIEFETDSLAEENESLKVEIERFRTALVNIRRAVKDVLTPNNLIALEVDELAYEALNRNPADDGSGE